MNLFNVEDITSEAKIQDIVITPDWCSLDCVKFFKPTGRILDPCKGNGSFLKHLPGADWCEIREGKDFWNWEEKVDWIISNPPYSCFRKWLKHSFNIADNIVYLIPVQKIVLGYGQVEEIFLWGGIKHIRWYGTGNKLGFPYGNAIGAVYMQKNYKGETGWSFYR